MNIKRLKILSLAAVAAVVLTPSVGLSQLTNILIQPSGSTTMTTTGTGNQCSSSGGGGVWQNWFVNTPGITNYDIIFDTANPPPTGAIGSMLQKQGWDGINSGTLSTFACVDGDFWGGRKIDMAQYSSIELDFKYDTASTMTPVANQGFDLGVNYDNNGQSVGIFLRGIYNTGTEATNFDGAWHHLSTEIPANIANAAHSEGVSFKIFNAATVAGTFNYWIANIELIARVAPVPNPTMTLEKTVPGLKQFADAPPNYNRQSLRTDISPAGSKNIDWVGHPGATYSWTFSEFPGPGHAGFNVGFTLTWDPADAMTNAFGPYSDPDWSSTNVLWVNIVEQNDGSVLAGIAYKTNQPSGNSQMFGAGTGVLTGGNTLAAPTAVGTWSLSFASDTSMTLTAPSGASTNVSLPPDVAASYTNISFALYTGMANDANVGQAATLTRFRITNVAVPVDEDLTDGALNTPFLRLDSQGYGYNNPNPTNQIFVTSSDLYWLHWTLPDSGFVPVYKATLSDPYWTDFTPLNGTLLNGSSRWIRITPGDLPGGDSTFYAVLKRAFVKLQILFAGESPAPNTPSGKTGTAIHPSIAAGGGLELSVRAVDQDWNLVPNATGTIHVFANDPAPTQLPADAPLVNGVALFDATTVGPNMIFFGTAGTWTVTATNVTDLTKGPASANITVDP